MRMLSSEQLKFWNDNGYLILPKFYRPDETDDITAIYWKTWKRNPREVVVDDLLTRRRCHMSELSSEERTHLHFRVNDLYLDYETVRMMALSKRIIGTLTEALGDKPVLCRSYNLLRGLAQVPLAKEGKFVSTWIALEDVRDGAGPIILPNGEKFLASAGDVLVQSGELQHACLGAKDAEQTRSSIEFHFLAKTDCRGRGERLVPLNGGYWISRPGRPSNFRRLVKRVLPAALEWR